MHSQTIKTEKRQQASKQAKGNVDKSLLASQRHQSAKSAKNVKLKPDGLQDDKVPLPSTYIALPSKSPSRRASTNRTAFLKEKLDFYDKMSSSQIATNIVDRIFENTASRIENGTDNGEEMKVQNHRAVDGHKSVPVINHRTTAVPRELESSKRLLSHSWHGHFDDLSSSRKQLGMPSNRNNSNSNGINNSTRPKSQNSVSERPNSTGSPDPPYGSSSSRVNHRSTNLPLTSTSNSPYSRSKVMMQVPDNRDDKLLIGSVPSPGKIDLSGISRYSISRSERSEVKDFSSRGERSEVRSEDFSSRGERSEVRSENSSRRSHSNLSISSFSSFADSEMSFVASDIAERTSFGATDKTDRAIVKNEIEEPTQRQDSWLSSRETPNGSVYESRSDKRGKSRGQMPNGFGEGNAQGIYFERSQKIVNEANDIGNGILSSDSSASLVISRDKSHEDSLSSSRYRTANSSFSLTRVSDATMSPLSLSFMKKAGAEADDISGSCMPKSLNSGPQACPFESTPNNRYTQVRHVNYQSPINGFRTPLGEKMVDELIPTKMEILAKQFYERRLVQRFFKGWLLVRKVRNEVLEDLEARRESKRKAKAWVKWTVTFQRRKKERSRSVFMQWKEIHLQMKREILLKDAAQRQHMIEQYYEWRVTFDTEQQNRIASLHFKISILMRCFQVWRVYSAERRVKKRMNEAARIHLEVRSTRKSFLLWKNSVGKSSVVTRQINKRLLMRVFHAWRKMADYSRVLRKRHLSACKEYHNRSVLKNSLDLWRNKLKMRLAAKHEEYVVQRRAFTLWSLKSRRKTLRMELCTMHANKVLQSKFFTAWKIYSQIILERRNKFVNIFTNMQLRASFETWRDFTLRSCNLNESSTSLLSLRSTKIMKEAFSRWKRALAIINFTERAANARTQRAVRNAATRWMNKIKKKHLQQRLNAASPLFDFLCLKNALMTWIRQKHQADKDSQQAIAIASILNRGCISRVFAAWRIVTQEDRIIHHMVARIHRRHVARVFDAWRLVVTRKKVSSQYRRIKDIECAGKVFFILRQQFLSLQTERQIRQTADRKILSKIITNWKGLVDEIKTRKLDLARKYFHQWHQNVERRTELRERIKAEEAKRQIKLTVRFRIWSRKAEGAHRRRLENERKANEYRVDNLRTKALLRWKKQFHVCCIVSEYLEDKKFECLDNAFIQWKEFVRQQLQDAVGRFTDRLEQESPRSLRHHTMSESASVDIPFLRSSSGYFGSLPNVARINSPLPLSPLATARSLRGKDSPLSLSPDYPFDRSSPKSPLHSLQRSNTLDLSRSSPSEGQRTSSFDRSRSLIERPRSPHSIPSSGSLPNRNRSPVIVPPAFTDASKEPEEEYTELIRPSSLNIDTNEILNRTSSFLHQRDKSMDEETSPSIFGNNYEEDAMSYYSFQSESIGLNREHFMSGAIRHWRHLPLSKTFRAWFKFTQEQKVRRELYHHFVAYKHVWTVKRIFYSWHRKLYCRSLSERLLRACTLRRGFKALLGNWSYQKAKEERNMIAQLHHRNTRMESTFKLWKKKFTGKRRLQSLIGRWQEAVHISETEKSKSDRLIKKREGKLLKQLFDVWREASEKSVVAKELSTTLLLKRIVRNWHRTASSLKLHRKNFNQIVSMRTSKVFIQWKMSFDAKKKAELHFENIQTNRHRNIFLAWLHRAKEQKRLSEQALNFKRRSNFKLIASAFFIWSEEAARYKLADDHYREAILIRVIESWHNHTEQRIDLSVRLEDFQQSSVRFKLRNAFDWWKRSAICSGVYKTKQSLQRKQTLTEVFSSWRNDARERRAERHSRFSVERKAFRAWSQRCFLVNRQRKLAKKAAKIWITATRIHQNLEKEAEDFLGNRRKQTLQKSFLEWREAANGLKIARIHYEYRLVTLSLRSWFDVVRRNKELRRNQALVEETVEFNLMSAGFSTWVILYHRMQRNAMVLENYLELKQQEHLKLCLTNFRINALKGRAEKHLRNKLQTKAFHEWVGDTHRCKALSNIRQRLLRITVLNFANKWRERTRELVAQEKLADNLRRRRHAKELKNRFHLWLLKTRGRSLARMCFQGHLLKSSFQRWRKSTQHETSNRRKLAEYKQIKKTAELRERFQKWKALTLESQRSKKLEEVHEQIAAAHFRKCLVEKCFYSWRKECLVGRMLLQKNKKICAQFFTAWKNHCLGSNRAEKLNERLLIEKAWKQWRKMKIKRQVIKAMELHENKKRISEVFVAWYNYTYIRRQALEEFKIYKKGIIFRRWMQEYNKS